MLGERLGEISKENVKRIHGFTIGEDICVLSVKRFRLIDKCSW